MDAELTNLAELIYRQVSGADNNEEYARLTSEIYDWLDDGDGGEGRTVASLSAEWIEREEDAADDLTD